MEKEFVVFQEAFGEEVLEVARVSGCAEAKRMSHALNVERGSRWTGFDVMEADAFEVFEEKSHKAYWGLKYSLED